MAGVLSESSEHCLYVAVELPQSHSLLPPSLENHIFTMDGSQSVTMNSMQMCMEPLNFGEVSPPHSNESIIANRTLQSLPLELRFAIFDLCLRPPGSSEPNVIDLTVIQPEPGYWSLIGTCKQFRTEIRTWLTSKLYLQRSDYFGLLNPTNTLFRITIDQHYRKQKSDFKFGIDEDLRRGSDALPWGKWSWTRLWEEFKHIQHLEFILNSPDLIKESLEEPSVEVFMDWYRSVEPDKGSHDNSWAIYAIISRFHALKTLHVVIPWDQKAERKGLIFPFAQFTCGAKAAIEFKLLSENSGRPILTYSRGSHGTVWVKHGLMQY